MMDTFEKITLLEGAFWQDHTFQRIGRLSRWTSRSRVLEIGGAFAARSWSRQLQCEAVVAAEETEKDQLLQWLETDGLSDAVHVLETSFPVPHFQAGDFDGIASLRRHSVRPDLFLKRSHELLVKNGRLIWVYPVKTVASPSALVEAYWQKRTGWPLFTPTGLMQRLREFGFEPESGSVTASRPSRPRSLTMRRAR
jgi:hypothetical protein